VKRWLPPRLLVVVAESSDAALACLPAVREAVTVGTRVRRDAALDAPAPARRPGPMGRPRQKGTRLPTLQHGLTDPKTRGCRPQGEHGYGHGPRPVAPRGRPNRRPPSPLRSRWSGTGCGAINIFPCPKHKAKH
jgi:hypothetical protein